MKFANVLALTALTAVSAENGLRSEQRRLDDAAPEEKDLTAITDSMCTACDICDALDTFDLCDINEIQNLACANCDSFGVDGLCLACTFCDAAGDLCDLNTVTSLGCGLCPDDGGDGGDGGDVSGAFCDTKYYLSDGMPFYAHYGLELLHFLMKSNVVVRTLGMSTIFFLTGTSQVLENLFGASMAPLLVFLAISGYISHTNSKKSKAKAL
ncbi:expressed unknown protein [Seminavis robusta]|uniref:Uncharacterized protein n=1 Tax=Seminavis robusta TaxID=568900 RepID=A0A9N8HWR9_9STRA|nr:expressed unknown protein [Seminavis robusta]|eukprot:Sro2288_g322070.1 n/a (211) ;mRNA; r:4985-6241